jgi:hypothetical protein
MGVNDLYGGDLYQEGRRDGAQLSKKDNTMDEQEPAGPDPGSAARAISDTE